MLRNLCLKSHHSQLHSKAVVCSHSSLLANTSFSLLEVCRTREVLMKKRWGSLNSYHVLPWYSTFAWYCHTRLNVVFYTDKGSTSVILEQILSAEPQPSQNVRLQITSFTITEISPKYSRPVLSKRTLSFKPRRSSGIPERKTRILMDPTISLRNTFPLALT